MKPDTCWVVQTTKPDTTILGQQGQCPVLDNKAGIGKLSQKNPT